MRATSGIACNEGDDVACDQFVHGRDRVSDIAFYPRLPTQGRDQLGRRADAVAAVEIEAGAATATKLQESRWAIGTRLALMLRCGRLQSRSTP